MNLIRTITRLVLSQHFQNDVESRNGIVQYAIAFATLIGICLDSVFRISTDGLRLVWPMGIVSIVVVLSIVMMRRGMLNWSGNLLLWTLLGFLIYLLCLNDGIHDTAILGIPAVLTGAGLILKRKQFFFFTSVSLLSIVLIGSLEMYGLIHNRYSQGTSYLEIIDQLVILGITTLTIRLLSDGFSRRLSRSQEDEMAMRKHAVELKESGERYRTLFEGANDAIMIMKDGLFVECNTTTLTMFGCKELSDIVGRSPWDFSPDGQPDGRNSREKALEIIHNALNGLPQRFYWKHHRVDGTLFDAEVSLNRLQLGAEILVQAFVRDVTENKQMENRVRESEEYYRKLVETSPEAIIIVDPAGILSFASQKAYEMFGVPAAQPAVGFPILQWVAPEEHQTIMNRLRDFFSGQLTTHAREYRLLKQNRTQFWCEIAASPLNNAEGRVAGILMVCRDVSERKNAEDALRESEERFSRLSDAAFEGIVISERGRVVDLNEQITKMLGYKRSEMIGSEVMKFVAPDSVQLVLKNISAGNEEPYEHLAQRNDGSTLLVEARAKSLPYNGHKVRVTAIRDITDRQRAEESLRASEQKYRTLFESANDAMFIFDPATEIVLEANSKALETYGFSREEFIGLSLKSITMDAVRGEHEVRRILELGSLKNYETVHFRKDGTSAHFLVNSSVIDYKGVRAILSISRDITDRMQADEILRLQSAALQTAANAIVITDRAGVITYVNSAFTRITGYTTEEALGNTPKILKSGEQPPEFYENLWATINAGNVWRGELVNKRKDGSFYSEEMTITPVQNEQKEITHFIAIKNDITDRKRLQEQLVQAQKMEGIGTLAGGIAHDFNNILGIILGHVSLIPRSKNDPLLVSNSVDTITKAVQRGAGLVRQILTFARKTEIERKSVNVNALIVELTKMFQQTFPKTIEIVTDLDQSIPLVAMDQTQFQQAIMNLCINGRDAMEESSELQLPRGVLTIRTTRVSKLQIRLKFTDASDSEYICVEVRDTGVGMNESTKQKIFEPFYTTKELGKGTGLGLAVVYGVVKGHHGFIDVESERGKGTTFSLYLPSSSGQVAISERSDAEDMQRLKGSETILLIEDEASLLNLMTTVLVGNGYTVISARDGIEAIAQFEQHRNRISLVLTDMGLPKRDGSEVVAALKSKDPNVKVIIVSGYLEPHYKAELLKSGAKDFVQKPYVPDQVLKKIRKVLDAK